MFVASISAGLAGLFALSTKLSELRAQRRLESERRIAVSRSETFEPLIEKIGEMWDQISAGDLSPEWMKQTFQPTLMRFTSWVQIYGSDQAVWAAHRLMQSIYHEAPPNVLSRLLADLILAARKDLAHPETRVEALDVIGMRITDIYEQSTWGTTSLQRLIATEGWTPPWGDRFKLRRRPR